MFELDTTEHPVVMAADSTDYGASTFERISGAINLGAPAAVASGVLSVANTFLDMTGGEQINVEDTLREYDTRIGDYYAENKNAIDITGFIASSVVGGSLAIKGVQLLRGGNAVGSFGRALNFATSRRDKYFQEAMKEMGRDGGGVRGLLNSAARRKSLGWEMADQAALGLAAEVAIVGTMYKNPVFDGDSYGDFAQNMALGAALSGGIGGIIGGIAAKGLLVEAGKEVQNVMRQADTVFVPEKLGLGPGTASLLTAESILKLSDDIKNVTVKGLDGKQINLDITEAITAAKDKATRGGLQQLQLQFNNLAGGDAVTGQAYFKTILEGIEASKAAGKSADETTSIIHGYLANVARVEPIDLATTAIDAKRFYVSRNLTGETPLEKFQSIFARQRSENTYRTAYMQKEGLEFKDLVIRDSSEFGDMSLKAAYRANPDIDLVRMPNGTVRVNPKSKNIQRIFDEPYEVKQYVHLGTGTVTPETVPVFGDIIGKRGIGHSTTQISAGGQVFDQAPTRAFNAALPPIEATARWAWASKMTVRELLKVTGGKLNSTDFPVLARLVELRGSVDEFERAALAKFSIDDLGFKPGEFNLDSTFIAERMQEQLFKVLNDNPRPPSSHVLAAQFNTTIDWVDEMIANGGAQGRKLSDKAKLLSTDSALAPQNVMVTWDFRNVAGKMTPESAYELNMGPGHLATKELTKEYQLMIRQTIGRNTQAAVLGEDMAGFEFAGAKLSKDADIQGAGAGVVTASNASYGERARLWVQNTGKQVELVTQRRRDAVVESLNPYLNAIKAEPVASAELGIVTNVLRLNPNAMVFDKGYPDYLLSRAAARRLNEPDFDGSIDDIIAEFSGAGEKVQDHVLKIKNKSVYDFLKTHAEINQSRRQKTNTIWNAMGHTVNDMGDLVAYVPPIDTVRRPYIAFVKPKKILGLADDVGMISARTEDELRTLMADVGSDFDTFTKGDGDAYFKAKGQYEYGLTINESRVNSELARRGKLGQFYPETRYENIATDYLQWHARQEEALVRGAVQVGNREFFAEMEFLSSEFRKVAESQSRGIGAKFRRRIADPFGDYIKTALNISKQSEFPLLDSLNEFVDKLGVDAGRAWERTFRDAKAGIIPWEDANKMLKDYGHGGFYKHEETYLTEASYLTANEAYAKNLIRGVIGRVNSLLAGTTLRLDFANSIVNIISTPIMLGTEVASIKNLIAKDSKLTGQLNELMSVAVPGTNGAQRFPSTTKLIYQAVNNYFGKDKDNLIKRYQDIGSIKDISRQYFEMLDDLAFRPDSKTSAWLDRVEAGIEKGSKFTGNTFSEEFTRFISADVMKQITDPLVTAGKLDVKAQNAYISTFVNRVQGNYVSSQRPVIFQGTTGAAIGLFQTYAFNVLQQLHRHMSAGDKKTLATFGGLQTMVFGLNGSPFFDAINSSVVGSYVANNPEHKDLYSVLPGFNKELGDWILYGSASAFPIFTGAMPALYTRGDINPRHLSVVPINPMDIPAVQASLKLVNAVSGFGKNVMNGVDLGNAMLHGLEHQGWNRPLAGLAQTFAGRSTTANGTLISASEELAMTSALGSISERLVDFGGISRMLGARPMDEAVALQQLYRIKQYQALDRARIERLGSVVKTALYDGEVPTDEEYEDFMLRYARSGGRVESFNQAMQRWMRDANVSVVNQMTQKNGSAYSQRLFDIMGGEQLPDYVNQQKPEQSLE